MKVWVQKGEWHKHDNSCMHAHTVIVKMTLALQ